MAKKATTSEPKSEPTPKAETENCEVVDILHNKLDIETLFKEVESMKKEIEYLKQKARSHSEQLHAMLTQCQSTEGMTNDLRRIVRKLTETMGIVL